MLNTILYAYWSLSMLLWNAIPSLCSIIYWVTFSLLICKGSVNMEVDIWVYNFLSFQNFSTFLLRYKLHKQNALISHTKSNDFDKSLFLDVTVSMRISAFISESELKISYWILYLFFDHSSTLMCLYCD